ncbi:MAG TPA: amino acid adenylation domain-containing protein [Ktedonobacteraceae bacterium]
MFINTLVMRARINRQHTFRELLSQVRETTLEAYAYQDLPFEALVEALAPTRNMGHHPLFQVMFVLQNAPVQEITLPEVVLQPLELDTGIAKFDLTLAMEESSDGLRGTIEYSTELFEAETINRLIGHFQVILESIVADPGQALWHISLLTQQEQMQLLHAWNRTEKDYPRELCVTQLIAEQAARCPTAIAVICGEERLCYRELDEQANQLAHYLQKLGVGPEILVGIHLPRSIDLLIAMLGILKAGGAYVPLEISLPAERISLLIQRTHMPVVITQQYLQEKLPDCDANILALDAISTSLVEQSTNTPENRFEPEHLAYILYTSGSTGEPKGVMVPHRGLMNYLYYSKERYGMAEGHGSPVHSPLGFDLTVTSIFTPLLLGQSVELLPHEHEVDSLQTVLSQHKRYSLVKLTPAHLMLLNQWLQPEDAAESAYTLVIGGEELRREQIAFWQEHAPNVRLINEYGPTETVVGCCIYEAQGEERSEVVPIGKPINNTQLYLLDSHYQLVPTGIPGELYIGGEGVTRGYFQKPDLTAERYVPHPYSQKEGERLYRTGDLACYRADGNLVFLGRIDQQVKLRGYRIELGEIENVLKQHPQVQEVLVIVREDQRDDKRLVAYVVPAKEYDEATQLLDELQQHMHAQLPSYMLPGHTLLLDELPLTSNGKVDRKALPVPELRESKLEEQQLQTAYEQQLAIFWQTLLRVERVSPNSNFFELGGHSLLLTQLATRIRSTFHVELPLRQLFQAATLVQMAKLIADAQREQQHLVDLEPIQPALREHPLPLSFAQQRLWFLQQFDTSNSAYNIPLLVRLTGNLKKDTLEQALTTVIARHELLRTTFSTIHGEPVQVVQQEQAFRLPLIDLSSLPSETQAEDFQQIAAHEIQQPFDLELDSPIRGSLLKIAEQEHILLLTLHHIVSDAWSTNILIQEIATVYTAEVAGKPSMLPALPIQYADFAVWQRNWLQGAVMEALLGYWKAVLADAPPLLTLPTDRPRPAIQTYRGATLPFVLTQELSIQLGQLARSEQVTMFMLLLSAFALLLNVYSHQDDVVIGTPIANRTREEAEQLIGVFINTLALRTHVERKNSFRQLLQQVRESTLEAYAHQDLPFEALVDALAPERNLSYHPLFQVMFVLQNTPQGTINLPDLQLQAIEPEGTIAKFDLSLSLEENKEGLRGTLEYNTDLFTSATIARMLGHFQSILQAIVTTTEQPMWQISPLMQWEHNLLLVDWNQTEQAYPQEFCLHELFEAQVKRSPTTIAVMCENEQLTYHELNEQANELAHLLRERGVQADSAVGICLERSLSMVTAIFGVLKAGGAYVPLDPGYPQERLAFMLAQARVPLLITSQALAAQFTEYTGEVICTDNLPPLQANETAEYKGKTASPDNLAYLLYTSGSTGQPKGVMMSHRAICNHMHWFLDAFPLDSTDRVLQKTPFSFDASVWEFYAPLLSGGTLVMAQPRGHQDSAYMIQAIRDYHITTLQLVPSQLQMLVEEPQFVTCHSLRWLFCGGEELPVELYHKTLDLLPVEMHNLYGPSETCIDSITWHCRPTQELNSTPIGRPIANMQAYVLDEFMQLVPVGVPGELYLGGVDLARGYMQRPELTAARFVPHPFSTHSGERLYRTGDLVRYLPDSTLQYLGRIDQQVKVRGFRIELGEIEAVLNQHPLTQECAVIVREDHPGDRRLVAYLVFREQPAPGNSELRQFLLTQLPGYMVPSYFVMLERLPLLPNGKIARTQLPAPGGARPEQEQAYVAPRTAIEQNLADIWAAVLGIELIGINDNFFELGGDSILSIQIIARANEAGLRLTPKQIFQHQTIAQLAEVINQAPAMLAEQGPVTGAVSLTPIQHWFFEQDLSEPHHWNQAMFLEVRQKLDSAILEQALQRLMSQHDALRMRFTREAHGWQQVNQDEEQTMQLLQFNLAEKTAHEQTAEIEHIATQLQASLHLAEGQLIRVALFHLGEHQPARLLVVLHHLIIDGVSWIILLEDLQTIYQQLSRGKAARLPLKTSSYQQWAQQLISYARSEELQQELDYWLKVAHEAVPLPLDFADGTNLEGTGETISITLSKEETSSLLQKMPATYHTEINDVLLTVLAHAYAPWLKTKTVLVDLEGHGREPLFEEIDLSRTIGWFTSIYPVMLNLGESGKPWEELKLIKEQLRSIPHHGIGYGLLRYLSEHEEIRQTLQTQAQAEISFNYFGQFDQSFAGSSLFRTAAESSGPVRSLQGQRHYKVEVTGYVEGGELHMSWRYSTKLHRRSSIAQLAERFKETLQDLIRHCEEEDVEGYTPSDFPAAALSQKDLDKLLNKINQPKRNRNRA